MRAVGTGGSFAGKTGLTVRVGSAVEVVLVAGFAAVLAAVDGVAFAAVEVEVAVAARGVLLVKAETAGDEEKVR